MKRVSEGKIEVNHSKKSKLTESEEAVIETSSETLEDIILDSSSRESEEENKTIVIDSSNSRIDNIEITESNAIKELKPNSNDTKQHSLEGIVKDYISTLQKGITDETTCDHIVASILDIYIERLHYTDVLQQIRKDVDGIRDNHETYEAICGLATLIAGYNRCLLDIDVKEYTQDTVEWRDMVTGEVYNTICDLL